MGAGVKACIDCKREIRHDDSPDCCTDVFDHISEHFAAR
jgi:hypothetical protein